MHLYQLPAATMECLTARARLFHRLDGAPKTTASASESRMLLAGARFLVWALALLVDVSVFWLGYPV